MTGAKFGNARAVLGALACACVVTASGCAAPRAAGQRPPPHPQALAEAPRGQDPSVLAARARAAADAALADGAPGMFESLQVRVRGLGRDAVTDADGVRVGARLKLERPFRTSMVAESLRHRGDASLWLAHAAHAEAEGLRCELSVQGRIQREREAFHGRFRERVGRALLWAEAMKNAGEFEAVIALETVLAARRALLARAATTRTDPVVDGLGELPDVLADRAEVLDLSEANVYTRIAAEHPSVLSHAATAERYRSEAVAEKRGRLPWVDFVQLDYATGRTPSEGLAARFAVGIPLDDGARGRSKRAEQLSESERFEADSTARALSLAAQAALAELHDVETHAADYRALLEAADAAEVLAARLVDEHRGTPKQAVSLFDDAAGARQLVLEASERAGVAACTLKLSTGTGYASWPRQSSAQLPEPSTAR